MSADRVQSILNEIGGHLQEDIEYSSFPIIMYAEAGDNFSGSSMFRDTGDKVLYRRYGRTPINRLLIELWDLFPSGKQWTELEYVLRDGRFDVAFIYPDDILKGDDQLDRRDRAVHRHFGVKPIIYPPMERGDDIYKL